MDELKVSKCDRSEKSITSLIKRLALDKADELVDVLKSSVEYERYTAAKAMISDDPQTFDMINEYRFRHFQLQIAQLSGDEIDDDMDELETLYQIFSANPDINEYLRAEYAFSRLLHDVQKVLLNGLDVSSDMGMCDEAVLYN